MVKYYKKLIGEYFKEKSFVQSNIESFNNFMDHGIQDIINEISEIVPTIVPSEVESFRIKLGKISIEKPEIVEADGSKRKVFPMEARLRGLTYAAKVNVDVSVYADGVVRETFTTELCKIPVMVRSKYCHLHGLSKDELIKHGEDPNDFGGYFILNGNERVLVIIEDLVSNKLFVEKGSGPVLYSARLYSERSGYRVPIMLELMKDGIVYASFTRFRRIPVVAVIKALGLISDEEISNFISKEKNYDTILINLMECADLKHEKEALEFLAKKGGFVQTSEERITRTREQLDKYLLPHIGMDEKSRLLKAYVLCKLIKKFLMITEDGKEQEDKDHFMNKRLKLSGDLLSDLFRINLRMLIQDILYNFQRLVKRGKYHSFKIVIRNELLTSRILSAMSTGIWVGGRKGVSQNIDRTNALATLSHLQRVVSLLESEQENFEARALHGTHFGLLCPVETPEGPPIGLRKNLALLCSINQERYDAEKLKKLLEPLGLKVM